ncbi:hypothetical protein O6P43_023705 [Quillaja saponaria]|uniref:Uncharacterized protein n=1 Tax=Quillaja saponaria TaxID=32244 RepID=A0AAD7LG70_QUISA|nr:hypothetical protein O6P43_023705 [Quillaja saponaria]
MEEVNLNDITVPRFSDDAQLDEEEYAENDEWEDDDENDNVELDVDSEEVGFEYEMNLIMAELLGPSQLSFVLICQDRIQLGLNFQMGLENYVFNSFLPTIGLNREGGGRI